MTPCTSATGTESGTPTPPVTGASSQRKTFAAFSGESYEITNGKSGAGSPAGGKLMWGGAIPMPANPSVTPDEANKLVKWVLSLK